MTSRSAPPDAAHTGAGATTDLGLAVQRIACLLGVRQVAVVDPGGALPHDFGELEAIVAEAVDPTVIEASRDGVAVVCGELPPDGLEARALVVTSLADDDAPLETAARAHAAAEASGWRVAHQGLVRGADEHGRVHREEPLLIACRPDDDRLLRALDNGPLSLALDPAVVGLDAPGRPARVLIASYEITGPTGNGGIGTAYHSLAYALAGAGHDVTLLFTGWLDPEQSAREQEWHRDFAAAGIDFALLGTPWDVPVRSPHYAVRRAYELHRWLVDAHAQRPFDVVHVPECQGHGALAQTAKALGLAYADVEFVVGTHSSTRWIAECNREGLESVDQLVTEHLERRSVACADVLLSPSAYLVNYMRDRRWALPERTFVQQYARPKSVRELAAGSTSRAWTEPPSELVFFGRLETRKGLEAFCEAVDLLVAEDDCPFARVTLLGRLERVMGVDAATFIARRAERWDLPWTILPDLGHDEAIAYLRSRACVVAIPSLVDNSPNTVSEAIALGVPFVASRSGGTAELIATGDLASATFDGWRASKALEPPTFAGTEAPFDAQTLATALRAKAAAPTTPTSPAVDSDACDRAYDDWHRAIAGRQRSTLPAERGDELSVAVCVVATGDAEAARVIASLRRGTRQPQSLVTVFGEEDGGSANGANTIHALGRDAGRARDEAIAALDADVLIVLRSRDDPDPTLVEQVCTAMAAGVSDVLSLVCRDPVTTREVDVEDVPRRDVVPADLRAFVPVSGPPIVAAAYPALSVGPYAIRREALTQLGGYAPDAWGAALDHELLARAALCGLRIDVLPDPLLTQLSDDEWSVSRSHHWGRGRYPAPHGEEQIRILRPFRQRLPESLADLPALLAGALRAAGSVAELADEHRALRQELIDAYEARVTEQRDLIALYEERQEEMRAALGRMNLPTSDRTVGRLRRAVRPPIGAWPGRAVRFGKGRIEQRRHRTR
ncbi:MAG TPA: glycosyltransferase [Conexibacter sp.]|nr:glycosyltransferase [Conexibacter sp.]